MSVSMDYSDENSLLIGDMGFPLDELLMVARNDDYSREKAPFCWNEDLEIAKIDDLGCSETFPNYYFDKYYQTSEYDYDKYIYYIIIKKVGDDFELSSDAIFSIDSDDLDACFWNKYDIIDGRVTNDKFKNMLKDYYFEEEFFCKVVDNVNWFTFDLKVTKCPDNSYILK
jgi:hypothetical protein